MAPDDPRRRPRVARLAAAACAPARPPSPLGALARRRSRPPPATDEGGLLLGLWRREMGASLAYDRVAHLEALFVTLRGHEADHAAAIATELAAVGLGTPRAPQWVGEIDVAAEQLARADAKSALPPPPSRSRRGSSRSIAARSRTLPDCEDRDDRGDDPGLALPARTHPAAPD